MKWEYCVKVIWLDGYTVGAADDALEERLDKFGAAGWELVTAIPVTGPGLRCILKRQRP